VIDLHCHVLPGIDDGPATMDGSVALAKAALAAGMRTLVATPHVSSHYPNEPAAIAQLVRECNERLEAEGVALEVRFGAEIAITRVVDLDPGQLRDLALGGGSWLLIEFPFTANAGALEVFALDLIERGHRLVIAHPERCAAFHGDRSTLRRLVDAGALTSITAGSLVGRFGGQARRVAFELVREELVHNVASDAHDHLARAPGIAAELEHAGLTPLAEWLTDSVPAAILGGEETIPGRPPLELAILAPEPRRRWLPLGR
jgi:protein-tyrosine phosphatase